MEILKRIRIFVICMMLFTVASCGDDVVVYTMSNTDEALCSGKRWVAESYLLPTGVECTTYELCFVEDGGAKEIATWKQADGGTYTYEREITWRWTDNSKECLQLIAPDGTVQYLENVWVREHYLSCKVEGQVYVFKDANYLY